MSSTYDSKTMSDASSTYSTVSSATTLKGDAPKSPKWYSAFSKTPKTSSSKTSSSKTSDSEAIKRKENENKKKQLHHEAVATYLALR
ncbi:hypothetical protein N7452_010831 [Penicillium brevicompactum]|uniref:Uncharacterized protein n=1 Tax=Penicillium brevicompactum TaxID=5074 RepID=A0A9W9Q386_PENBR|nr:hypothetical protein N7452_010831 [Penicillium brevicompactum]